MKKLSLSYAGYQGKLLTKRTLFDAPLSTCTCANTPYAMHAFLVCFLSSLSERGILNLAVR